MEEKNYKVYELCFNEKNNRVNIVFKINVNNDNDIHLVFKEEKELYIPEYKNTLRIESELQSIYNESEKNHIFNSSNKCEVIKNEVKIEDLESVVNELNLYIQEFKKFAENEEKEFLKEEKEFLKEEKEFLKEEKEILKEEKEILKEEKEILNEEKEILKEEFLKEEKDFSKENLREEKDFSKEDEKKNKKIKIFVSNSLSKSKKPKVETKLLELLNDFNVLSETSETADDIENKLYYHIKLITMNDNNIKSNIVSLVTSLIKFSNNYNLEENEIKTKILNALEKYLREENYSNIEYILNNIVPDLFDILVSIDTKKIKMSNKSCFRCISS